MVKSMKDWLRLETKVGSVLVLATSKSFDSRKSKRTSPLLLVSQLPQTVLWALLSQPRIREYLFWLQKLTSLISVELGKLVSLIGK